MSRHVSHSEAEVRFAALYHRHSASVMAYARRRCGPDDAADVVSETFVVAWRRLEAIPEEPASKPWLLGVARRSLANQRRGNRRRGQLIRKASTYLEPRFTDVSAFEGVGESQEIVDAMNTLPENDRELLMLSAWEQLTPAEIAVTLDVSSVVVRKRLFRARKRMAEAVGDVYQDDAGEPRGPEDDAHQGHAKLERRLHQNEST